MSMIMINEDEVKKLRSQVEAYEKLLSIQKHRKELVIHLGIDSPTGWVLIPLKMERDMTNKEPMTLVPCPFCNGEGWVIFVPDTKRYRPQCKKCGCDLGEFNRRGDAEVAWNTRAHADARDTARYRWWRENIRQVDEVDGFAGVAFSYQVPLSVIEKSDHSQLMDAIADAAMSSTPSDKAG
jgi:hypothetical protein